MQLSNSLRDQKRAPQTRRHGHGRLHSRSNELKGAKTKTGLRTCVMCCSAIYASHLSFEQRLIGDEDFCRMCWDEIMSITHHEDGDKEEKDVLAPYSWKQRRSS